MRVLKKRKSLERIFIKKKMNIKDYNTGDGCVKLAKACEKFEEHRKAA